MFQNPQNQIYTVVPPNGNLNKCRVSKSIGSNLYAKLPFGVSAVNFSFKIHRIKFIPNLQSISTIKSQSFKIHRIKFIPIQKEIVERQLMSFKIHRIKFILNVPSLKLFNSSFQNPQDQIYTNDFGKLIVFSYVSKSIGSNLYCSYPIDIFFYLMFQNPQDQIYTMLQALDVPYILVFQNPQDQIYTLCFETEWSKCKVSKSIGSNLYQKQFCFACNSSFCFKIHRIKFILTEGF